MAENKKKFKQIVTREYDQSGMCYISMNLARQALQTNHY